MRWSGQVVEAEREGALPGLARLHGLVATTRPPEFAGITCYEVHARSALNRVHGVPEGSPLSWTINPYRGCSHACVYCFARPTHRYLEIGDDGAFDTEIVVKTNLVEVLRGELARRSWQRHPVSLGTNTDPYQRVEGRYRLMPGVMTALADSRTPFSLLTKGTLLRRDVPLLADLARRVPVDVSLSIAVTDGDLQKAVEPGAPTAAARLATVRAVREAGLDCGVLLMPVLPWLTDSEEHLDAVLGAIAASGATSVQWSALHLKPGVREFWTAWLEREHPELVAGYGRVYGGGPTASRAYRAWLDDRARPIAARHGLRVSSHLDEARRRAAQVAQQAAQPALF